MKLTKGKIADLLSEPGCEHNHKKGEQGKNKACTQQAKPGAAQLTRVGFLQLRKN